MKKLNITKEQFNRSRYFKNKYGKLEYVSESGKLFKTDKGKIVKFLKESCNKEDIFESNHTKLIPREKRKSSQKFNRFFKKLYAMNNGDDGKHHDRATRMEHPYDNVSVIFTSMLEIGHIDEPEVEPHLRKVRSYIIKTAEENGWKWTYDRFGMSIEFIITEDLDEEQLNETSTMKKLNITKEGFEKSKYFTGKYGKLEYVSESGKLFKTNKGKILMFKEYHDSGDPPRKDRDDGACDNLAPGEYGLSREFADGIGTRYVIYQGGRRPGEMYKVKVFGARERRRAEEVLAGLQDGSIDEKNLKYVSENGKLLKFKEARMPRKAKPKMESFFVAGVNCVEDDTGEAQRFWFYEDALDWIQSELVTEETQADEVASGNTEFSVKNVISELKRNGTAWCDSANVVFIKEVQYEDKYGSEDYL